MYSNTVWRPFLIGSIIYMLLSASSAIAQSAPGIEINGTVSDILGEPLPEASIYVKDSFIATVSDQQGQFSIVAPNGSTLVISAFLMENQEIAVGTNTDYNIKLYPDAELLEAVTLRQENEGEDKVVQTPFNKYKKKAVGYARTTVRNKDFWSGDQNVFESIIRNPLLTQNQGQLYFRRSLGSINRVPVMVILDGAPVDPRILRELDPDQVDNVSMVRSLAGTVKYGQLGAGGVIYVNTELTANFNKEDSPVHPLTLSGNDYNEQLVSLEESLKPSDYLIQLKSAQDFGQAQQIYERHTLELGLSSLDYYLEAADYFNQWDQMYSHNILSNIIKLCNNNPQVLMGIAYQCEQLGRYHQAAYLYEELMLIQPDHVQSYLDLAQIYTQIGDYKKANSLYRQMLFNRIRNMDFSNVEREIISEYRRFLTKYRSKVNFRGLPNELLVPITKKSVRIVLEWTNPLTNFEVQFVSPKKKFYNWSHSPFTYKQEMEQELNQGYAIKEFLIEDGSRGDWIVNINPVITGDESALPTFVKYTVYQNYGLSNEKMEVKVVPLNKVDQKVTLDEILN